MKPLYYAAGLLVVGCLALTTANAVDTTKLPPASTKKPVTYDKDIRPLFEASCIRCHGEERPKADLRLDKLDHVLRGSREHKVIVPGKSSESILVHAVAQLDDEIAMPPQMKPGGRRGPGGGVPGQPGDPPPSRPAPNSSGTSSENRSPGGSPGSPGGPGRFGPPPKPLTTEEVGLVRAWIDQGAK